MELQTPKIREVLKSLAAHTAEEMAALRFVLRCADIMFNGFAAEPHRTSRNASVTDAKNPLAEVGDFLTELPEEMKRYLYGLIEAIEIYQSIHGQPLSILELSTVETSINEIRQIRDMCLEEGLRSIY